MRLETFPGTMLTPSRVSLPGSFHDRAAESARLLFIEATRAGFRRAEKAQTSGVVAPRVARLCRAQPGRGGFVEVVKRERRVRRPAGGVVAHLGQGADRGEVRECLTFVRRERSLELLALQLALVLAL